MLTGILRAAGLVAAPLEGYKPSVRRHKDWAKRSKEFLKLHPTCAACGGRENLTVHHVWPFHLYRHLEMVEDFWLPLCEGSVVNCHLLFGHLGLWASWNMHAVEDAAEWLRKRRERPKT